MVCSLYLPVYLFSLLSESCRFDHLTDAERGICTDIVSVHLDVILHHYQTSDLSLSVDYNTDIADLVRF